MSNMQSFLVYPVIFLAISSNSLVTALSPSDLNTAGFYEPRTLYSAGGHAICIEGLVPVTISNVTNVALDLPTIVSSVEATSLQLQLQWANSDIAKRVSEGTHTVSGTFNISSRLCYPSSWHSIERAGLQFCTHGVAYSQSYWDFAAPNNSYVDSAAIAGYVTFSYDRLGIGGSDHPDPAQLVQGPAEIAIAHGLVQLLRQGHLAGQTFSSLVGLGHSYGSALTVSVAGSFPSDFDAVVLTGFSANVTGSDQFTSALNLLPASEVFPERFANISSGYLVPTTRYGVQFALFNYPNFDQDLLLKSFATVETTSLGEQFTMGTVGRPAVNYTGPAYVLNGDHDLFFCDGNCTYPENIAAFSLKSLFPNAIITKSGSSLLTSSGHGVNSALNAPIAFAEILKFVTSLDL